MAALAVFARAAEQLGAAVAGAAWALTDRQSREAVRSAVSALGVGEAAFLGLVRDLDGRPDAVAGARAGFGAQTFLTVALRRSRAQAARDVKAARALDDRPGLPGEDVNADGEVHAPALGAAFAAGSVTREHVDIGVRALDGLPKGLLRRVDPDGINVGAKADAFLAEQAQQLDGAAPTGGDRVGRAHCVQTGPISPLTLQALSCDAILQAVVLDRSGAVLDLGRAARTVSAAQRRALIARDRGCVVPGCPAPPGACDAHHLRWWRHGGATDLANLALVCGRHHADIHAGVWTLEMVDGVPHGVPPRWAHPGQPRLCNTVHHTDVLTRHVAAQLVLDLTEPAVPDTGEPGRSAV